jgi:type I restriction enzyme R subunit
VRHLIAEEIPQKVAVDPAYQNARKYSDKQNARIEHDEALRRVIVGLMKDDTDLFRLFSDNPSFKRWLADAVFGITYRQPPP